jgi:hypothetical protein
MNIQSIIRKAFTAAAISSAIGLTSVAGGAASADGPKWEPHIYTIAVFNTSVGNTGAAQGQLTGTPATPQTVSFIFEKIPMTYGTR